MGTATQPAPEQPRETSNNSRIDQITSLLKVVLWPLVVVVIYIQLHSSVVKIFDQLPTLVSHSSKLSYGSFSMEIQNSISSSGNPILADKLKGISEEQFMALMDLKVNSAFWVGISEDRKDVWLPGQERIDAWQELQRRGLVDIQEAPEQFNKKLDSLSFSRQLRPGATYHSQVPLTRSQEQMLLTQVVRLSGEGEKIAVAAVRLAVGQFADQSNVQTKH